MNVSMVFRRMNFARARRRNISAFSERIERATIFTCRLEERRKRKDVGRG
jgi:hypothetical protein